MNMNTWISEREKKHATQIAVAMEKAMMFGHSPKMQEIKELMLAAQHLLLMEQITLEQAQMISKMISSSARDNLEFAKTLIESITTQNSTQHVSNISSRESQVPELRS